MNIAVIGGGASGIMAAITAARCGAYVTIYEKHDRIGKKILATGNGRCNLSNINSDIDKYHGMDTDIINTVSAQFWTNETISFFSEIGLLLKTEDEGKIYPYSDRATSVLDVLRNELDSLGVVTECNFDVSDIKKRNSVFEIISYDNKHVFADKIIFAAGGKASPGLCGGNGYDILKKLGHSCTRLEPSIVQLKTDNKNLKGLKGIKCHASLTLNKITVSGELLFTDTGLSGPPAFYLSSYYKRTDSEVAFIDFFKDYDENELFRIISRNSSLFENTENLFTGIIHKRLGASILNQSEIQNINAPCASLSKKEISSIVKTAKNFPVHITGTESWNNAQITSGGIPVSEIEHTSMLSTKCNNLYITGEILDIDGNCGGYNLQWAWSTGYIAGCHAACN